MQKTQVNKTQDDSRVADLVGTLIVLNRGNFVIDAGREFQELADAIIATNKAGKLQITLTVTPSGWNKGTGRANQVDVSPEFSIKKPQHDQAKSIFFVTDENKLTRDDPDQPSIAALVALGQKIGTPVGTEAVHYALVPTGTTLTSLEKFQFPHGVPPVRIVATPAFQDAASFCAYVNDFKDPRTRLFADARKGMFTAVMDYHTPANENAEEAPEFLSHRAILQLTKSEEWDLWTGKNDKLIPQIEFAEFLEDNRNDIVRPDAATMLEIARELQAHSEVNFQSKINPVNGGAALKYEENINAKVGTGQIVCPETFAISVPVFFGEKPQAIEARLRFRISEGKLKFQYKLYRPAEILMVAFDSACAGVKQATGIEVLLGTL